MNFCPERIDPKLVSELVERRAFRHESMKSKATEDDRSVLGLPELTNEISGSDSMSSAKDLTLKARPALSKGDLMDLQSFRGECVFRYKK